MNDPMDEPWTDADEIVEEVREIRRKLWAQFDDDPVKMVAYLMERQKEHEDRLWDPRTRRTNGRPAA